MIAHLAIRRFRAFAVVALLPMLFGSTVVAQVNFGLNPSLASGNVTFNPSDYFTGSYSLTGSASLLLSANYTLPAGTTLAYSGTGSTYLTYTGGGPFTLTLPVGTSLTRSGGAGNTYVYNHVANAGTITVSGGALQFQSNTTLANAAGGTTTVTGAGSSLYLYGLANAGTLSATGGGLIQLAGTVTTANLGLISISTGGLVRLTGTINNAAAALAAPSGGTYTLYGGTITGGTIASSALSFSSSGGILDSATVTGNLTLASGDTLTLKNSGGATGTTTVNNATLYLGTHFSALAGSTYDFTGANSYLSYIGGGPFTFTLPATASLTRSGAGNTYVYDHVANSGAITVSGGALQFQSNTTFTNNAGGTATVTGSGSSLLLYGLANSGTITATSGGLVQLAGIITTANLGLLSISTGGLVRLTGTINNAAATLAAPSGGSFELYGGTIAGGAIASGALSFSPSGGILDGATVSGNLTLASGDSLTLKSSGGATGTTTVNNATLYLGTHFSALAGSTYNFTGANSYLSYTGGGPFTFTLPATASLTRSGAGNTYVYDHVANSGAITVSGGALQFQSNTTFANSSTATVTGSGSSLTLYGLANSGTITATAGGLIQLAGTITTANLGLLSISSGGVIRLTGTITNTSAALAAPSGGTYTLYGGTITGGTIASGALSFTSSGGTLDGATVSGNVTLASGEVLTLRNSAGATGTTTVDNATLYLGTNLAAAGGSSYVFTGANSYLSYTSGGPFTFTLPATASFTRSGAGNTYVYDHIANSGTLSVSGGSLLFQSGTSLTINSGGTATVTGASSTLSLYGLANAGTLSATNGGLIQLAGTVTTANLGLLSISTGGIVRLTGTINNASATLAAPSGGTYTLFGGTITGGTIANNALSFTSSGGYFDAASLTGDLSLPTGAYVRFSNAANFTGANLSLAASSFIYWEQAATLAGKALTFGANSYLYLFGPSRALTLDATTTATGQIQIYSGSTITSSITNLGTLTHTSGTGQIYSDTFTNSGSISANAGTLYLGYPGAGYNSTNTATGTVTADGSGASVYLRGNFSNLGTLTAQNSGILYFDGANTTGNIGAVTLATGGKARLAGTITNTALAAPTGGMFELYGGTISGGTIANNALTFTSSGGYLDNTSLTGDLSIPAGAYVRLTNAATFTGSNLTLAASSGIYWEQSGNLSGKALAFGANSYVYLSGAGRTLTLNATTTGTGQVQIYSDGNATSSITNLGTLTHTGSTGQIYAATFTNSGAISATAGTLNLGYPSAGYNSTNTATGTIISSGSGTSVFVRGNFANLGTLAAQNSGILQFDGTNTTGNLGAVTLATGGKARLAGTITNTALTAPTGGMFELYGGTITGGTIANNALTFTSSGGYLDNTSLTGDLVLPASAYVRFINGASFTGTNLTLAAGSFIYWQQVGTLTGKALTFGTNSYIYLSGASRSLTFDATTTGTGQVQIYDDGNVGNSVTNQGTLTHTAGSGYFYARNAVNSGAITATGGNLIFGNTSASYTTTNSGTVTADGASASVNVSGNVANTGTLRAQNSGTLVFNGNNTTANLGTVQLASGGKAQLTGTLTNTSATLNAPAGGAYSLFGGTLTGGTIANGALTFTSSGGYLDNTSLLGDLTLPASAYVRLTNTATFTGSNLTLAANSGIYWEQSGNLSGKALAFGANSYVYLFGASRSLTLDATTTANGQIQFYDSGNTGTALTNQGTLTHTGGVGYFYARTTVNSGSLIINAGSFEIGNNSAGYTFANAPGGSLTINGGSAAIRTPTANPVTNQGAINVVAGSLNVNRPLTTVAGGSVTGAGTITGNLIFTGGTLAPGNSVGTLTLLGDLTLGGTTVTTMELGPSSHDRITGLTNLTLGGQLDIVALTQTFTSGQTWNLFSATAITGSFASFNLPYTSSGWVWDTSQLATTGNLTLTTFVPVPEPSTYLLMAAGLALIVVLGRRRR